MAARKTKPRRAPSAATMRLIKQWFEGYEVREGDDGRMGIYTRDYNVRLARFNINTHCIQSRLKLLFNYCNAPDEPKRKPRKRRARIVDPGAFGLDCLGDGFKLHSEKRK